MGLAPKALIVIAAALAIAGCGGGSDTAATSSGKSGTTNQSADAGAQKQKPKQEGTTTQRGTAQLHKPKPKAEKKAGSRESGVPAPTSSNPLPNQGTKAAAPGVPTATGGDNSIQTYGVEADSGDRVQAASTAKAYLDARAAGRWAEACSHLSGPTQAQLEGFAKQAQGSSVKGCAGAMEAFTARVPKAALLTAANIHVISMRVKGDQAFLIYTDGKGTPSELPMARDGGEWKVGALAGSALVL